MKQLGEDVSEMLEYVPEHFKVIRHVRKKLVCIRCDRIVQAMAPSRPSRVPVGMNYGLILENRSIGVRNKNGPLRPMGSRTEQYGISTERQGLSYYSLSHKPLLDVGF
jgi:hypothetical protein